MIKGLQWIINFVSEGRNEPTSHRQFLGAPKSLFKLIIDRDVFNDQEC